MLERQRPGHVLPVLHPYRVVIFGETLAEIHGFPEQLRLLGFASGFLDAVLPAFHHESHQVEGTDVVLVQSLAELHEARIGVLVAVREDASEVVPGALVVWHPLDLILNVLELPVNWDV